MASGAAARMTFRRPSRRSPPIRRHLGQELLDTCRGGAHHYSRQRVAPCGSPVGQAIDRRRLDLVDIPWRRAGAGGAELVPEGAVADLGAPVLEELRDLPQLGIVPDHPRLPLGHDVGLRRRHGDHAMRIASQVLRLLRSRAGREVELALAPDDAHRHHMRPSIGTGRGQPEATGSVERIKLARLVQAAGDTLPFQRRETVAVQVLLVSGMGSDHCEDAPCGMLSD